jgi:hypothetical protein
VAAARQPKHGDLRVWWIPQIPGKSFLIPIGNIREFGSLLKGKFIMDALANYDIFQFENDIKSDYSNAGGVSIYHEPDAEWIDWYDADGNDIDTADLGGDQTWDMDN